MPLTLEDIRAADAARRAQGQPQPTEPPPSPTIYPGGVYFAVDEPDPLLPGVLWIPLNVDGSPKAPSTWQVYSGDPAQWRTAGLGSGGGDTVSGIADVPGLQGALDLLQDRATAATDTELAAAVATLQTAVSGKQDASSAATDTELAAAVATINTSMAGKQDAATAATDAELASAIATVNASLTSAQQAAATTRSGNVTLALTDAGKVVEMTGAGAQVVTVPPSSNVAFPVGATIEVFQYATGAVAIAAGAGVTIRSGGGLLSIAGQYGSVALRKRATDEWVLEGALA